MKLNTYTSGFNPKINTRVSSHENLDAQKQIRNKMKMKKQIKNNLFDPKNPFTHWMKEANGGMFGDNDENNSEAERNKNNSAHSGRVKIPHFERLYKASKGKGREGFFRKTKNQVNGLNLDKNKEEIINQNIAKYEATKKGMIEVDQNDINFNELIFNHRKIPVKKYVEYKREIRLSNLRRADIEENIKDMKNLIVAANEELEENVGTEKKSRLEINQAAKESRAALERVKAEKIQLKKNLYNKQTDLNKIKAKIGKFENKIRDKGERMTHLETYKQFLVEIREMKENKKFGGGNDAGELSVESEINYDNIDDDTDAANALSKSSSEAVDETLITAVHNKNTRAEVEESENYDTLNEFEAKESLLRYFKSPIELVGRLRAIEAENLFIIQLSQNTKEDIDKIENQIKKIEEEENHKINDLAENIKNLSFKKEELERKIKQKKRVIDSSFIGNDSDTDKLFDEATSKLTVNGSIVKIFNEFAKEEYKREYKKAGILMQLLGLDKTLDYYIKFKKDQDQTEYKDAYKKRYLVEKNEDTRKTKENEKKVDQKEKHEKKEHQLDLRVFKNTNRPHMEKTYLLKTEKIKPESKVDKEHEEYLKYFT